MRQVRRKEKHLEVALEVELANREEQIVDGRALNLIVIELEVRGPQRWKRRPPIGRKASY